ncbi:MAG: anthranilate phosphoribosyltransferase [Pseudomonadales bacterium]|nr:anthranilate phosphoribosyltransferase [Pseudomonadales bacterium]
MALDLLDILAKLSAGESLSREESQATFLIIMKGEASDAQIGSILTALHMKGESVDEIAGATAAMRQLATRVDIELPNLVDTCGTGGSGKHKLFNISTAAAFVAAAAGANIAKHGNRAASSKSGSADVLEAGGINISIAPEQISQCVKQLGIGFMFAQAHHSAMRFAMPARRELGFRTIFNLVGPLSNPAATPNQVIGVFAPEWQNPMVDALKLLGSRRIMSVHSQGLDELSIGGPSLIVELIDNTKHSYSIHPSDVGLKQNDLNGLKADSVQASLALILASLDESNLPARDIVALNAGASIYIAGLSTDLKQGVDMAMEAIASGKALQKWQALAELTTSMTQTASR